MPVKSNGMIHLVVAKIAVNTFAMIRGSYPDLRFKNIANIQPTGYARSSAHTSQLKDYDPLDCVQRNAIDLVVSLKHQHYDTRLNEMNVYDVLSGCKESLQKTLNVAVVNLRNKLCFIQCETEKLLHIALR